MLRLKKFFIYFLKESKKLSALSCRFVQLTGKSKYLIHPKHLVKDKQQWYLKEINHNDFVLDLGCGNGQQTIKVAKKCKKVIGLDYNYQQLHIARKIAEDQDVKNVEFRQSNLEAKLKFKSNFFDKIFCLDVLEHIYNRKLLLNEIKRLLKKNGILFISVPNKNTSWKKIQKKAGLNYYADPDHKIEYSLKQIKLILIKAGFLILSIEPIVYDTPWVGFIDLIGGFSLPSYKKLMIWKKTKLAKSLKESTGFRIKAKKNN